MTLGIVWSALFVDYSLMTVVIPIFPVLGAGEQMTGILFSSKAAVQIFSAPFVASVIDRYGFYPLVFGLAIEIGTTLVFSVTQSYGIWLCCRATQGFASACIISTGFLQVQQVHAGDNVALGRAMGIVTTGIISGVVVAPAVGGILYGIWRPLPFFAISALAGVVMLSTIALARSQRRALAASGEGNIPPIGGGGSAWSKARGLCYDWQILLVLGALFSANAAISCLEATIGIYAEAAMGLDASEVGFIWLLAAIPSVTGAKISGGLGQRFGRRRVILAGMLVQGVFFALGPKDIVAVEMLSLMGLGFGMGLVDGTAPSMLARRTELRHHGTGVVYTLATVATQAGFLVGPVGGSAGERSLFATSCTLLSPLNDLFLLCRHFLPSQSGLLACSPCGADSCHHSYGCIRLLNYVTAPRRDHGLICAFIPLPATRSRR